MGIVAIGGLGKFETGQGGPAAALFKTAVRAGPIFTLIFNIAFRFAFEARRAPASATIS